MTVEFIDSVADTRLDVFRSLKLRNMVRDARLFVAEGPTVVERVLRSGVDVVSVLVSERKWGNFQPRLRSDVTTYRVTDELAEQLIGFEFHAGVMACAVRPASPDIATIVPPAGPSLILAGDRITDPENVGALIRIASAFGAAAVLLGPGSADPFSRRVLRVSMGNVLYLPVAEPSALDQELIRLQREMGFDICGTVLEESAMHLPGFHFRPRTVLVFGNEYDGLTASVRAACHHLLTIPMENNTDSLNIAIAAGIFSWQYRTTARTPSNPA